MPGPVATAAKCSASFRRYCLSEFVTGSRMSRVAKMPVLLPKGVDLTQANGTVRVKGPKGELSWLLNPQVEVLVADGQARISSRTEAQTARAVAGTTRALLSNMVNGVSKGFERKLELVGVGYRAQAQGKKLNLTLGFSHPVAYPGSRRHHDRHTQPDRNRHQGRRQAQGRPGCRRYTPLSAAGALQGQGRAVCG